MTPPILSIIIPVFNTENYLNRCIDSVLEQDCVRQQPELFEVICVNDGSTDNSAQILTQYAEQITILTKPNGGLSSARNLGLDHASGDYILFIDSDDYLLPGALQKLLDVAPNVDAVIAKPELIYPDDFPWDKDADRNYFSLPRSGQREVRQLNLFDIAVVAWGKLYKRSIIEHNALRFPEGILYEDNYFFWTYFACAKNVYVLNDAVCAYVKHAGSIMANTTNKKEGYAINRIYIFEKIYLFYQSKKIHLENHKRLNLLAEIFFHGAMADCPDYEKPRVLAEMIRVLRAHAIDVADHSLLSNLKQGKVHFTIGEPTNKISDVRMIDIAKRFCPAGSLRRKYVAMIYHRCRKWF